MTPSPIAIAGMVAAVAIVAPARAAVLNNWTFDTATRELMLTLPDGITPDYFLLAEPARIVLDIPGTTLGAVPSAQQYDGAIHSIRLSEVEGRTRIVIEFAPNTRLDPRHAELTSTALGNGQTEWTLRPLLQDAAPANVATQPPAPTPAPPPATVAPVPEPAPAVAPPSPTATSPTPETVTVSPDSAASESAAEATTDAPTQAAIAEPPTDFTEAASDRAPESIAVIPAPDNLDVAETSSELPSLPDIARSATTGAAQALPTRSPLPDGVRTDAAALAGINETTVVDTPPEQLPIDPFAASSQAVVSVPSLDEADSTPAPQVAVPSIAEVPDVLAAPTTAEVAAPPDQVRPPGADTIATVPAPAEVAPEPPAPSITAPETAVVPQPPAAPTAIAPVSPNQVRPPSADTVATAPTPPEVAAPIAPPEAIPAPPAAPSTAAIAVNSIEIPTIPLPPDSWGDRANTGIEANQIRPPRAEAIAQVPTVSESAAPNTIAPPPSRDTTLPPPVAIAADASPLPAPPSIAAATIPPPPAAPTATEPSAIPPNPVPPPPFLDSPGSPPRVEQPTIPPPPNTFPSDGTVPFGAPLPQTKSLGEDTTGSRLAALSGIPIGTRMALQYSGPEPLVLEEQDPTYEVLTVVGDVYDPDTGTLLLPYGSQVLGRFEGFDESGRRFVTQTVIRNGDRVPLLAESDWILGTPQPNGTNVAIGSSIGAAAVTVLTGFSGLGLVGGAALGAGAAVLESPQLVVIEPGQIIEAEVVADILPFNDAPDITHQYR
jgi:hypothetical protein